MVVVMLCGIDRSVASSCSLVFFLFFICYLPLGDGLRPLLCRDGVHVCVFWLSGNEDKWLFIFDLYHSW